MDKELINTGIILVIVLLVSGAISILSEYSYIEGLGIGLCGLFVMFSIYCILWGINQ